MSKCPAAAAHHKGGAPSITCTFNQTQTACACLRILETITVRRLRLPASDVHSNVQDSAFVISNVSCGICVCLDGQNMSKLLVC